MYTTLPVLASQLEPSTPEYSQDSELVHLLPGDNVYINDGHSYLKVLSYKYLNGTLRKNRRHLHLLPNSEM